MERSSTKDSWNEAINPKYEYISVLGTGSYGCVCLTTNTQGEKVAIKKFTDVYKNPKLWLGVMREIEILKKLKKKNIVEPIEIFTVQNDIYLVLEYMELDLHKLIKECIPRRISNKNNDV